MNMSSSDSDAESSDDRKKDSGSDDSSDYDSDSSVPMDPELKAIMDDMDEGDDPDDIPKQSDQRCRKMKNVAKEWGMGSSCHGVPHMAEAHTIFVIIIWVVILLSCLVAFCYLFSDTLMQYLRYEKIVMLKMGLDEMDFPAVTICNMSPYKLSQIQAVEELEALIIVYEKAAQGESISS